MQVDCIMHLYALHAFFDLIGSLEFYFDFLGIFDGLRRFFANPVRSIGEVHPAVWTNLGQSGTTLSGWIWWSRGQGSSPIIRGPHTYYVRLSNI